MALLLGLGPGTAEAAKRVALVIGNSAYKNLTRLNNPHRDAEAVASLLKSLGWEVIKGIDLAFAELHDAVAELESKAGAAELAMVYYAGHGMSNQSRDFVAPIDMPEHCANDTLLRAIPLDRFFLAVEAAQSKVVVLDACRNQPFPNCAKRGVEGSFRGLSRVQSSGLLIVSATGPGGVAEDGIPGAHSPFTRVLLDNFRMHSDIFMHELLFKVVKDVSRETRQRQVPEIVVKGDPLERCLSTAACGPLAVLTPADIKKRQQMDKEAMEKAKRVIEEAEREAERLRRRAKEREEKQKQTLEEAEEKAKRVIEEAEREAERLRRRAKEKEDSQQQTLYVPPPPPPPPAVSACGWYAIAYCSQDYQAAQARTGAYSGYVINTSDSARFPNFRPGWYCVARGPMGRGAALSAAARMKSLGATTAYAKSSC